MYRIAEQYSLPGVTAKPVTAEQKKASQPMFDIANPLQDESIMPFGKHKGMKMLDVPVGYLHWIWHNADARKGTDAERVKEYIVRSIDALKGEDTDKLWQGL